MNPMRKNPDTQENHVSGVVDLEHSEAIHAINARIVGNTMVLVGVDNSISRTRIDHIVKRKGEM